MNHEVRGQQQDGYRNPFQMPEQVSYKLHSEKTNRQALNDKDEFHGGDSQMIGDIGGSQMKVHNREKSNPQKKVSKPLVVKKTPKREEPVKAGVLKYETYDINDLKEQDKEDLDRIDEQYYLHDEKKRDQIRMESGRESIDQTNEMSYQMSVAEAPTE